MSRAAVRRAAPPPAPRGPTGEATGLAGRADLLTAALQIALVLLGGAVAVAVATLAGNSLSAQKLVFVATFGLAFPAGCVGGARLSAHAARRSPEHLALLAGAALAGILALVVVARIVDARGGSASVAILIGAAALAVGLAALVAFGPERSPSFGARLALIAAGVLVPVAVAAFLPARLLRPGPLAVSIVGAAVIVAGLLAARRARLPPWLGALVDLVALALAVLWVVDVSSYLGHLPYDPHAVFSDPRRLTPTDEDFAMILHQNFYLAPVNDVLHGRAMLVDTYSQYGAGVVYFVAAFFKVAPLGYGPMALLVGTVTALEYAAGYAILRIAGCGRLLAAVAVAVGITVAVFGTVGSVADLPSVGGLRYGPAYALVLAAVAAARWPSRAGPLRAAQLAVLALASVWSIETFGFVAATFAATSAASAAAGTGTWGQRVRRWLGDLLRGAGACLAAIALFALLTLVFTGSRPHLRPYLAYFNVYSGDNVGLLGIPLASAWSAGFAEAALFLASAAGVVGIAVRRGASIPRPWLVAAAGVTTFGIVEFTYWVSHASSLALPPLAFPAILVGALWTQRALVLPRSDRVLRLGTLALAGWLAALLVVFWWPQVESKYTRSAAWQALPGGPPLVDNLRALWHSPVLDRRASEGERLLRRYFPGKGPAVVLMEPDLTVETLIRSRRVNRLPLGDVIQDDLITASLLPRIVRTVDRLAPGTPMLIEPHADPRVNAIDQPTPLELATYNVIRRRFDLQTVTTSASGLSVVRLVPHRAAAR
ncbi:MAG TPA: hypothetical protein VGN78_04110 [Solirubrobacteraceae bacterium]|nr:hypothetical protein [Solirubrobacteraceae bacterium]